MGDFILELVPLVFAVKRDVAMRERDVEIFLYVAALDEHCLLVACKWRDEEVPFFINIRKGATKLVVDTLAAKLGGGSCHI